MRLFGFHANLNKAIRANEHGEIAGDAYAARNGRWTVENSNVTIADGDTLHYWIYAQADGDNNRKNNQRWVYSCKIKQFLPIENNILNIVVLVLLLLLKISMCYLLTQRALIGQKLWKTKTPIR